MNDDDMKELQAELDKLERENPEVAKAAAKVDAVVNEHPKGADGRVTFESIKAFMDRMKNR